MIDVRQYIDGEKLRNLNTSTEQAWNSLVFVKFAAVLCFIWYLVVLFISNYGVVEIFLKFNGVKKIPCFVDPNRLDPKLIKQYESDSSKSTICRSDDDKYFEGVTILRPLKGIDPEVEACLESSILQYYPIDKFEVLFCVEDPTDPVIPIVKHLMSKYSEYNLKLLIGDPENQDYYGPNPKINNLAKGFVAAKYDTVWVMDSNVWCSSGTLLRSVTALNNSLDNGRPTFDEKNPNHGMKVKIVHHVPLAMTLNSGTKWSNFGCKLDEIFLKTSHAKFYVSFNKLAVAPCINGKSNMYRISDIDAAVSRIAKSKKIVVNNLRESRLNHDGQNGDLALDAELYTSGPNCRGHGIRYFSKFIGEDNMIGIALWETGGRSGLTGDCVIQPLGATTGIKEYILRRLRWLRVRKYMVLIATLLEPTTESILAGIYGTFGISVLFFNCRFNYLYFMIHFLVWFTIDYFQFHVLLRYAASDDGIVNSYNSTKNHEKPYFTDPNYNILGNNTSRIKDSAGNLVLMENKNFKDFLVAWLLREILAFPIWAYAMIGTTIDWRGRPFKINSDLTATNL